MQQTKYIIEYGEGNSEKFIDKIYLKIQCHLYVMMISGNEIFVVSVYTFNINFRRWINIHS